MDHNSRSFEGNWLFTYWYPSNNHDGEDKTEYHVKATRLGDQLLLESFFKSDRSCMFVRLTIEGNLANGTWYEKTSPYGEFKGATYSGAGQLVISEDCSSMEGKWAGIGVDHGTGAEKIYTGRWRIEAQRSQPKESQTANIDFSGVWISHFGDSLELDRKHYVSISRRGSHLMIGGMPSTNNSSIVLRLVLEGLVATGSWQEYGVSGDGSTMLRHGGVQFVLNPVTKHLVGSWVGFGEKANIDSGHWEIKYSSRRLPKVSQDESDSGQVDAGL